MGRKSLAIIHFNPIELYPPIINLLNYLGEYFPETTVYVFTNNASNKIYNYTSNHKNVCIERYGTINQRYSLPKRYWNYLSYYYKTYSSLKKICPNWLWYFETISALPASWYLNNKKNQSTKLIIHYHEYMSREEYESGPLMVKLAHRSEKKLYDIVNYLSHTNEKRMEFFLSDNNIELKNKTYVFPNYPPKNWISPGSNNEINIPIKVVYVGAIGMDSLYIKEFCKWVHDQNGKVRFDIFSNQDTNELQHYLSEKNLQHISIKGYVRYDELPSVLKKYDVGVILYNGHIPNYIYNAPNKLFEYWACGLDVWFPDNIEGSLSFVRHDNYPKIISIDFKKLDKIDLTAMINRTGISYKQSTFYCEKIFEKVTEKIFEKK